MNRATLFEIIRFGWVGVMVMLFHMILVYLLTEIFEWWYLTAVTFSYTCSLIINFLFQKYYVWLNFSSSTIKKQAHLFIWLALICLALNTFFMFLLVSILGLYYMVAQICVVGMLSILTFHVNRKYIFSSQ